MTAWLETWEQGKGSLHLIVLLPMFHEKKRWTRIVGKGGLYLQMSFIYKYKTLHGFIKGVSGGRFILINK